MSKRYKNNQGLSINSARILFLDESYIRKDFPESFNQKISEYQEMLELSIIKPEEFIDILKARDSDGMNIFHHAACLCTETVFTNFCRFVNFFGILMQDAQHLEDIIFDNDMLGANTLHYVIESDQIMKLQAFINLFINNKFSTNKLLGKTNMGLNILHYAVDTQNIEILTETLNFLYKVGFHDREIMDLLIEQDLHFITPVHSVIESCGFEMVEMILNILSTDTVRAKDALFLTNIDEENVFHIATAEEEVTTEHLSIFLEVLKCLLLLNPTSQDIMDALTLKNASYDTPIDNIANWDNDELREITFNFCNNILSMITSTSEYYHIDFVE